MGAQSGPGSGATRYTVVAEQIGVEAWHLTVRGLPDTWTVAFSRDEIEDRARQRIALDLGIDMSNVDIVVEFTRAMHVERRSHRRDELS